MVQQCSQQWPVQNSEVYVLRQVPPFPPLSPPSPITPAEDFDDSPIDARSLTQPDIAVCGKKLAVEERLSRAVHVLATEATALQTLTELYTSDRLSRDGFTRAVDAIVRTQRNNNSSGKVVVIGVGKSGHIAKKLVATFNSLAIQAVFLHPTEALHGDLGQISRHDTLLLITFSGKTPELLTLLPHLDRSLPLILLTSHTRPETCEIVRHRPDTILLPAPVHEAETASFGVAAPTTSTTVALAVGDALAIVASRELHASVAAVFARNHPGGAIGAALWQGSKPEGDVRGLMVSVADISVLGVATTAAATPGTGAAVGTAGTGAAVGMVGTTGKVTGLDVLRAAYASPSGWVRLSHPTSQPHTSSFFPAYTSASATSSRGITFHTTTAGSSSGGVVSPRKIKRMTPEDMARTVDDEQMRWLVTPGAAFIPVAADTSVLRAAEWIRGLRAATASASPAATSTSEEGSVGGDRAGDGSQGPYGAEAIVAVMERGECVGLLEVGKLLEEA